MQKEPVTRRIGQSPVAAVLPGGGWTFSLGGGRPHPVLAWVFFKDGSVEPVAIDPNGLHYYPAAQHDPDTLFYPPQQDDGEKPSDAARPAKASTRASDKS